MEQVLLFHCGATALHSKAFGWDVRMHLAERDHIRMLLIVLICDILPISPSN